MAVGLQVTAPEALLAVAGVQIGVTAAGVRKAQRKDLTLITLSDKATVGAVFTQNRFCAAPVQWCKQHLASGKRIRALVINTGVSFERLLALSSMPSEATVAAAVGTKV